MDGGPDQGGGGYGEEEEAEDEEDGVGGGVEDAEEGDAEGEAPGLLARHGVGLWLVVCWGWAAMCCFGVRLHGMNVKDTE